MEVKIKSPFFVFNPKSYLFGEELMELAKVADELAKKYTDMSILVTCPYADISQIAKNTTNIIVTAQHIDGIRPGVGIGHVLPESVHNAGARATFLNHAEKPLLLSELKKSIDRAKEIGIRTIVCADSVEEAKAITMLKPDVILCEPTELIGTGKTSDDDYIKSTNEAITNIDASILVMQAAGISSADDVYRTIRLGAHGTGCTSGIVKAKDPVQMLKDMVQAAYEAYKEREKI